MKKEEKLETVIYEEERRTSVIGEGLGGARVDIEDIVELKRGDRRKKRRNSKRKGGRGREKQRRWREPGVKGR